MSNVSRRRFLTTSASAAAAAWMLAPTARVLGANEELRIALIGCGGRGAGTIEHFHKVDGARVVAVCDPDESHMTHAEKKLQGADEGIRVGKIQDVREIINSKEIDAVYIASPNHWHSLMAIWAIESGKHVYVEKPVSHNIWEGRQMVAAAKKHPNLVVQGGFQNRSDVGLRPFMEYLHSGQLGEVKLVRGFCYRKRNSIGKRDVPLEAPETCDVDLWHGPAEVLPMMRPKFHYDWHWVWNTGNGDIGNQGPHEMDLVRWALNDPGLPSKVVSFGRRYVWADAGQTPNMQFAEFDFDGRRAIFEVRDLPMSSERDAPVNFRGVGVGIVVECEGGEFRGGRGGGWIYDHNGKREKQFPGDGGGGHIPNFINACINGKPQDLHCEIESAHLSSALSHMANISLRLGSETPNSQIAETFGKDELVNEVLSRFEEQVTANGVNMSEQPMYLGPALNFDAGAERFVNGDLAEKANSMLSREYRAPYVVTNQSQV